MMGAMTSLGGFFVGEANLLEFRGMAELTSDGFADRANKPRFRPVCLLQRLASVRAKDHLRARLCVFDSLVSQLAFVPA